MASAPLRMPKLALAMTEGTIVDWLVRDGDVVREGQALYIVETDKVETEVPAASSGVVHPTAQVGETYPVGAELGWVEVAD